MLSTPVRAGWWWFVEPTLLWAAGRTGLSIPLCVLGVVAGDMAEDNGALAGRGVVVRVQGPPSRICELNTGEDGAMAMTCECPRPARFRFPCPHQMFVLLKMKRIHQLGDSTAGFVSAILGLGHKRWRIEHESPATGVGGGGGAGAQAAC